MAFRSPSGTSAVEIWQTKLDNSLHMRVELVKGTQRRQLYQSPNDAYVRFVHVYWSPDEAKVGILASGLGVWPIAFNINTGSVIPFSEVQDELVKSVRQTYRLPPDEDPLKWSVSPEAGIAFFQRHPEVHVDYGPNANR